jgi:hypothetical protein
MPDQTYKIPPKVIFADLPFNYISKYHKKSTTIEGTKEKRKMRIEGKKKNAPRRMNTLCAFKLRGFMWVEMKSECYCMVMPES